MELDYKSRLTISCDGNADLKLYTKSGLHVATGYVRVVIGDRGPYVEFSKGQVVKSNFYIPDDVKWKRLPEYKDKVYYYELRSKEDNVKLYYQTNTVDYADYKIGLLYMSPFELYDENGIVLIEPKKRKKK